MNIQGIRVIAKLWLVVVPVLLFLPWEVAAEAPATLDQQFLRAAAYGDLSKVKSLLRKGANINTRNGTGLIGAARGGHVEVVRLLSGRGNTGWEAS